MTNSRIFWHSHYKKGPATGYFGTFNTKKWLLRGYFGTQYEEIASSRKFWRTILPSSHRRRHKAKILILLKREISYKVMMKFACFLTNFWKYGV